MSEESVDIHIRLSTDGARMLEDLLKMTGLTSKSAYIEEMIFAVESIMAALWTYDKASENVETEHDRYLIWQMFNQYLLALIRRLGWPYYREYMEKEERRKKKAK